MIDTIETLRTLREHTLAVAVAHGLSLSDPIGPDRAAQLLNEAALRISRVQVTGVTK